MPDRLQSYRNQVSDAVDAWQANVCNPYIIAYNTAYKSYNDTFKKQNDSDKARAEPAHGHAQSLLLAANQASFGERSDAACGMRAVAVAGGMPAGQQGAGVSAGQGNA